MGFLGKLFIGFIAAVVLLGIVGWIVSKWNAGRKGFGSDQADEILPEKTVNNVLDVRDRFNRARYMDEDGK